MRISFISQRGKLPLDGVKNQKNNNVNIAELNAIIFEGVTDEHTKYHWQARK